MAKEMLFATTKNGQDMVVKCYRENDAQSLKAAIIPGKLTHRVEKIEILEEEIPKQIQHDFKKLGEDWEPDTDLFLKGLVTVLDDQKKFIVQRLENCFEEMLENREVLVSDQRDVFWYKPDDFFLGSIRCLCNSRPKKEERDFFNRFIEEQTEDRSGVLMLKVTFNTQIEK
jgi:hypothetical protein